MPYSTTITYIDNSFDAVYSMDKPQWIDGELICQAVGPEFIHINRMFVKSIYTEEMSHERLGGFVQDISVK